MTKKEYILDFLKEINYAYNHPAMYDDLKRLLDEMEEEILESANCKWIPVTERLPEEGKMVLVTECNALGDDVRLSRWQGETYGFTIGLVKAWMPLPKPYGGDTNANSN